MQRNLRLNNGALMPVLGLGTYNAHNGEIEKAVKYAIDVGYRHFDCAWFYGNEKGIGKAINDKIKEGKIKREDLFITSKLWNNFHAKDKVEPMLRETLKSLNLDYIDLYLIHWPFGFKEDAGYWPLGEGPRAFSDIDYLETWEAMEKCQEKGLTKSIGVSNFNSQQLDRLLKVAKIKPVVNQVEVNVNLNQKKLIEFCKERDIVITGYCPLSKGEVARFDIPPPILDPKVIEIAKKHKKTPAQVILNYLISLGISVIPKSSNPKRINENFDVFDFTLDKEDVEYLDSLNRNMRICFFSEFKDHPHYPFNIEF